MALALETETATAKPVEVAQETATTKTKKVEKTGDLILDVANEVETLSKTQAINQALKLAENIDANSFRLGGLLKVINDNSWFEGFPTFNDFVLERFGFASRKAHYLIEIYTNLVDKLIPWEKVQGLGWTKLKDLAKILTKENVDEWVEKASKLTVAELLAVLKAPDAEGDPTQKTNSEIVKVTLKFKPDQAEIFSQAVAKAKGELKTEFDTVAVENIMAGYVGGNTQVATVQYQSAEEFITQIGFEPLLNKIADMFPMYDISVEPAKPAEVGATA
jgi:hypothetical protein